MSRRKRTAPVVAIAPPPPPPDPLREILWDLVQETTGSSERATPAIDRAITAIRTLAIEPIDAHAARLERDARRAREALLQDATDAVSAASVAAAAVRATEIGAEARGFAECLAMLRATIGPATPR